MQMNFINYDSFGVIVSYLSAVQVALPWVPVYSATKAGVVQFSRCIAKVCDSGSFQFMFTTVPHLGQKFKAREMPEFITFVQTFCCNVQL